MCSKFIGFLLLTTLFNLNMLYANLSAYNVYEIPKNINKFLRLYIPEPPEFFKSKIEILSNKKVIFTTNYFFWQKPIGLTWNYTNDQIALSYTSDSMGFYAFYLIDYNSKKILNIFKKIDFPRWTQMEYNKLIDPKRTGPIDPKNERTNVKTGNKLIQKFFVKKIKMKTIIKDKSWNVWKEDQ